MVDTGSVCDTSNSQLLRALASDTRRAAVRELQDAPLRSLDELASAVANDTNTDLTALDRSRQRLHHCHLPLLEEVGVVVYDTDEDIVEYTENDTLEAILGALRD